MALGENAILRASQWCYQGVWSIATKWFHVPEEPPHIQGADDAGVRSFRPAEGYLRYLKLFFWIGLVAIDVALTIAWLVLLIALPLVGIIIAPLAWAVIILPDIVAYIAIHLRYDTTWYVLSDRSMRIRRGIWTIHETTITYENIQNVSVKQGPVQRYFGIADVLVETAGGGAIAGGEAGAVVGHFGLLEGISNAEEVRNLILAKWGESRSAGVDDDVRSAELAGQPAGRSPRGPWSPEQVQLLESIRDLAVQLAK
jgi:membrane protein YdbS with pleckstrin-like domain